jgi:serine/threonine-protein kinase
MTDDPRVQQLLDRLHDSHGTPEEVCKSCPELLPVVRERWRQMRRVRADLDALFPPPEETGPYSPEEPALPQVPGYAIEAVLGRGGMGIVFRAQHLRLNRLVALKMLLGGTYAGPHERARFQREAEAVAGLRHENIVRVYDVDDHEGRPYFTMELVEGGSLAQKLAGAPLPARPAAQLLATLAQAMQVAHQGGVVHRDLKPANVLLTADGTAKISDFGLARRMAGETALTQSGVPLGTPRYMAPEQARGQTRAIGPAVDVYALGAILYELLTGRPPFQGETPAETLLQVIQQEPVPPARLNPGVPRDLETICLKCLHKEPQRRYASAQALADDLVRFQEGCPIQARPVGWVERSWRWCRRKPAAAALAVTVLALVGLALAGARSLELRQVERRAETARQDQAVKAALEKATILVQEGRWPEARAVLEGAQRLVADSAASHVIARVKRARLDADMVAKLEEIRLRFAEAGRVQEPGRVSPEAMYGDAFRDYEIPVMTLEPAEAAARLMASSIRQTLVAFMHDWLYWSDENRGRLREVLDAADNDPWRRAFREALVDNDAKKLAKLTQSPQALGQPPEVVSGLAGAVLVDNYKYEALEFMRKAQQRYPSDFWINFLLGCFWREEYPQAAVGYFRVAVAIRPTSDGAHLMLGKALQGAGDTEGAAAAFRRSAQLDPRYDAMMDQWSIAARAGLDETGAAKAGATKVGAASEKSRVPSAFDPKRPDSRGPAPLALLRLGRLKEAQIAWRSALKVNPIEHDGWHGYAELCLFLGEEDEYRRARRDLLERFGATSDSYVAERAGRACLLMPATGDELQGFVALTKRAFARNAGENPAQPYFKFGHGLAEYRQGHFDMAIATMRGDAAKVLGPGPTLVIAMALHQQGHADQARRTLASAVLSYDWSANQVHDVQPCILHALRREAERIILSNLAAFMDGTYRPQDNDERLALLGACQFASRTRTIARLYADAFATDPALAEDLGAGLRYNAARAAAQAGCGRGADATSLGEKERAGLREQARQWLRADLATRAGALADCSMEIRQAHHLALTRWQNEPDLAYLREPSELDKLAADERKECLSLWDEVATLLARSQK